MDVANPFSPETRALLPTSNQNLSSCGTDATFLIRDYPGVCVGSVLYAEFNFIGS